MRPLTFFLLFMMVCRAGSVFAADSCGDGACGGTRGGTVLSVMVWGVGLSAGIALLCGMLDQDTAHAH